MENVRNGFSRSQPQGHIQTACGLGLQPDHCAQWGAIKGMEEFSRTCLETGSDIFITEMDGVDNRPIALFNMFGLQEWMELGRRFSPKINAAKEFETKS